MRMRSAWTVAGVLVTGALGVLSNVNLTAQSSDQSLGARHTGPIQKTYTSTSDRGTRVSISTHGNIVEFKSPNVGGAQYEHLGVGSFSEGYVLCYTPNVFGGTPRVAVDTGDFDNGVFGPAIPPPNTNTVIRETTDGYVRFRQTFVFNGTNKFIQIKMDVTNISNLTGAVDASIINVTLRRQADFDVDTGGTQGWAAFANRFFADSRDGVTAWNDRVDAPAGLEAHALSLRHVVSNALFTPGNREAKVTADILDSSCNPPHQNTAAGGYARSDFGGTLQYSLGSLGIGKTASATVQYIRH